MRGSGSTLGVLGLHGGSGVGWGWWGVCVQTVSWCWGSDLGRGSWEDWTLMLWRLKGDFRAQERKMGCPASGQSPCSQLLFFLWVKKLHCPPQPHPSKWLRQSRICLQCRRLGLMPQSGRSPGGGKMSTHSSILAWRIPWTGEPGGL